MLGDVIRPGSIARAVGEAAVLAVRAAVLFGWAEDRSGARQARDGVAQVLLLEVLGIEGQKRITGR
jgi:hypothetical protein